MSLSRVENPCFLLFLAVFQAIFILILYRGGASTVFRGFLDAPQPWDYSKTQDVYTNLSLFTRAPDEENMPYCTAQSPIFGHYSPPHCLARYKSAIIVPHKNQEKHLLHLLYYLHPFLQRQQLHYGIYLIHQAGNSTFNRAKLLNVGVREAMKDEDWDCLLLHDVDLIPENDYNLYVCDDYYPKHIASAIDKFQYSLPYWSFFGGVSALTPEHYMKINGFPNTYWGSHGEDEDIAARIQLAGMKIVRTPVHLGRYKMVDLKQHSGGEEHLRRPAPLLNTRKTWKDDGMNSVEFKLLSRKKHLLYTNITVDIGNAPTLPPEDK
ncbi:beta-1,4-galactosyltransferase 3-like isoform X2 [Carettochelys insculpta]|uniref:beta-1,4-galactosyltransferase 3-like isoform X2 n=1 Tax=Carettochelys insculpta TaxID=44489 RepID=UPI003EBCE07D